MKKNHPWILMAVATALFALNTPLHAAEIDDRIESSFKESYVAKTYLKNDAVKAESSEGVVTLSGTVDQQTHKALAQETAQNLPGVTRVDNRLELKGEQPAESSNEWIAMKVNTMLLFNRNVRSSDTDVYVEEGIVTLRGEAESATQKDLITEYVKNVKGIESVRNEMTIAATPKEPRQATQEKIDDASITAQVKTALLTHRSTSDLDPKVKTKDGVVTLGGKASDSTEKDLVTNLVRDIRGVSNVINNMVV